MIVVPQKGDNTSKDRRSAHVATSPARAHVRSWHYCALMSSSRDWGPPPQAPFQATHSPNALSPVRGVNPEPVTGWPWHLTEYEVAYVQEFNVRPPRSATWSGTGEDERRLEQEADGIRTRHISSHSSRVRRNWPWVTAATVMILLAVSSAAAGIALISDTQDLHHRTELIEEYMSNG